MINSNCGYFIFHVASFSTAESSDEESRDVKVEEFSDSEWEAESTSKTEDPAPSVVVIPDGCKPLVSPMR